MKNLIVLSLLILTSIGFVTASQDSSLVTESSIKEITSSTIKNVYSKTKEEGFDVFFTMDYSKVNTVDSVIIKYCHKNETKKLDKSTINWSYTKPISASSLTHKIRGLSGGSSYVFKVGFSKTGILENALMNKSNMIWSKKSKAKTARSWGLYKLLVLIGALGAFIFGMKLMSEGLQQAAGQKMRQLLSSMTSNRLKGVLSGFFITGLVQSSSATTVMTVSFVNAGLLTLVESAGIMMGANIGTTITGWLIQLFGFKVSIASYSLIIIAIAAPMMFMRSTKTKAWGNALIGFALLFWGLGELKGAVPSMGADSPIVAFFNEFAGIPIFSNLIFILLGTLVTVVVQSSSAAMALTMTLCAAGQIPYEVACAMILGENIGTTITAELASMIGNVHAKRSARIHSLFNLIGVGWAFIALPLFFTDLVAWIVESVLNQGNPFEEAGAATMGMAVFHTTFNIINVVALFAFAPWLVKVATRSVKSKGEIDEEFKLEYIGGGVVGTSELAIIEAKKEVAKFGEITQRMNGMLHDLINETDSKKFKKIIDRLRKYEDITDRIEEEVAEFLTKVSQSNLTEASASQIRSLHKMIGDLERIGDLYYKTSINIERKKEEKTWFSPEQRDSLNKYFKLLNKAFEEMISNLNKEFGQVNMDEAKRLEHNINELRNDLMEFHITSMEKGEYSFKSGMHYKDIFTMCEKIGDHIINVSEGIALD